MSLAAPERAPVGRPERRPDGRTTAGRRPPLRVVGQAPQVRRARRRRARLILALSAVVVAGAMLAVAAAGSVVVSQQLRLDAVHAQVEAALAQDQSLQVQRASLQAPARILSIAERQLGMVAPATVHYLTPSAASSSSTAGASVARGQAATSHPSTPSSRTSPRR